MWYDNSLMLSHNKVFNFVVGNRGGGKTYNAKKWCINDYKRKGKHFVWIRRYKSELEKDKISRFFDDVCEMFPDDKLEVKGKTCFINGEKFGEFIALSVQLTYKSVPFPKVNKIIFDEFIILKGTMHYLTNEVREFLELFETIARMRNDVRVTFLGNMISVVNPYFLYFNIKPNFGNRFTVNDKITVEFFKDEEFIEAKKKTKYGKAITGTEYGDYAIENESLTDNMTFIEKKTNKAEFMCAMKYKNRFYGFWVDFQAGYIFVNGQYDPSSYNLYCLTKDDHEPNMLLIKSLATNKPLQRIIYAFQNGLVRFSDMQVKNQFYEFITFFIR